MSHTPTPWTHDKQSDCILDDNGGKVIVSSYESDHDIETDTANAVFIVKAVNAHDDLVAALKRVTEHLQTMIEYHPEENTSDIDAAIYCAHGALRGEL